MRSKLVFDIPLRMLHWTFALSFVTAFLIAKTFDKESLGFTYHMLIGLTMSFAIWLRVAWGFFGTRNSRFTSFTLKPKFLFEYFKGLFASSTTKWGGHNPASSWGALLMFGLIFGLGLTGFKMTTEDREAFEDIHEILANSLLIVVGFHIAGLVLHMIRHKDGIIFSMIDGKKSEANDEEVINKKHLPIAIVFLLMILGFGWNLNRNYDTITKNLNLNGTVLNLGEDEEAEEIEGIDDQSEMFDEQDEINDEIDESQFSDESLENEKL